MSLLPVERPKVRKALQEALGPEVRVSRAHWDELRGLIHVTVLTRRGRVQYSFPESEPQDVTVNEIADRIGALNAG